MLGHGSAPAAVIQTLLSVIARGRARAEAPLQTREIIKESLKNH